MFFCSFILFMGNIISLVGYRFGLTKNYKVISILPINILDCKYWILGIEKAKQVEISCSFYVMVLW